MLNSHRPNCVVGAPGELHGMNWKLYLFYSDAISAPLERLVWNPGNLWCQRLPVNFRPREITPVRGKYLMIGFVLISTTYSNQHLLYSHTYHHLTSDLSLRSTCSESHPPLLQVHQKVITVTTPIPVKCSSVVHLTRTDAPSAPSSTGNFIW
jgi:hypothetical protein